MTPAQSQYGQFGQALPHTGVNLTLIAILSVVAIGVGLLAIYLPKLR